MQAPEKIPPAQPAPRSAVAAPRFRPKLAPSVAAGMGALAALLLGAAPALTQPETPSEAAAQGGKLYLKNNTTETVRCRLSRAKERGTQIVLRPGQEYAERFDFETQLSLECPKLQKKAYGPLVPGRRYNLLPGSHGVTLFEATAEGFSG